MVRHDPGNADRPGRIGPVVDPDGRHAGLQGAGGVPDVLRPADHDVAVVAPALAHRGWQVGQLAQVEPAAVLHRAHRAVREGQAAPGQQVGQVRLGEDELAPAFAAVPGLVSKTWLADESSNTYGGVYLWANEASCQAYKQSDLFNTVRTHPNFANVSSREFGVLDGPSAVTRAAGPAMASA